ncbi:MAG: transcription elongation factor GreA [Patescibacteria group bacterium]
MKQNKTQIKKVQLTREGLEELQAELTELKTVKLPHIIDRVAKARAHGDLSENAEYSSAKEDQSFVETRISEIEDVLERAEIVAQTKSQTNVGIGSTVTVQQKGKSKKKTFNIVGEFESDPMSGKISSASPLGKTLIGKKKGETAKFEAPGGEVEYKVLDIK